MDTNPQRVPDRRHALITHFNDLKMPGLRLCVCVWGGGGRMLQGVGFTDDDLFVFATVLSPVPQTHTLPGPHARTQAHAGSGPSGPGHRRPGAAAGRPWPALPSRPWRRCAGAASVRGCSRGHKGSDALGLGGSVGWTWRTPLGLRL